MKINLRIFLKASRIEFYWF